MVMPLTFQKSAAFGTMSEWYTYIKVQHHKIQNFKIQQCKIQHHKIQNFKIEQCKIQHHKMQHC